MPVVRSLDNQLRAACEACSESKPDDAATDRMLMSQAGKSKVRCSGEADGCKRCARRSLECRYLDQLKCGRPSVLPSPRLEARPASRSQPTGLQGDDVEIGNDLPINAASRTSEVPDSLNVLTLPTIDGSDLAPLNLWPLTWPDCACLWKTQTVIASLRQEKISHATVECIRQATVILQDLLDCCLCLDTSRACFFNIQNVLLFSRLFYHAVEAFLAYSEWLKSWTSDSLENVGYNLISQNGNDSIHVHLSKGNHRRFVLTGLEVDIARLQTLADKFASRQREGHEKNHKGCSIEKCRKPRMDSMDDALAVCPKGKDAVRLIWCYRSVEDVEELARRLQEEVGR